LTADTELEAVPQIADTAAVIAPHFDTELELVVEHPQSFDIVLGLVHFACVLVDTSVGQYFGQPE